MLLIYQKIKSISLLYPRLFLFCLAFFYVLLAGLFIQFIFLPHLAPASLRAEDGLLSGYDTRKFHRIAVEAARQIQELGWTSWSFRPGNQIVSGIASIFYALITPKPWVLLPLNGLFHGIASLALFELIFLIIRDRKLALISSLLFVLFPSSLLWNAQLHNEVYAIPGVLLFLSGWVYLANLERALNLKKSWKAILSIILGSLISWAVRDYIMSILHLLALTVVIFLVIRSTIRLIKKQTHLKVFLFSLGLLAVSWFLSSPALFEKLDPGFIYPANSKDLATSFGLSSETAEESKIILPWIRIGWLPKKVDTNFYKLSYIRAKFIRDWSYAGSQIDTEIIFGSATDLVKYLPRALEVGFLAPFPSEWLADGYKKGASLMRKISGVEMVIVYFCLPGLIFSFWRFRAKPELWVLSAITIGMLVIYVCAIPNVGSLYRFRYPYLMPLVCLGLSGVILAGRQVFKPEPSG